MALCIFSLKNVARSVTTLLKVETIPKGRLIFVP
jgi:hypothetical protein